MPAQEAYWRLRASKPAAYTLTDSNTLARLNESGQRTERRTSGCRKNAFSFQSPAKDVPGTAISAKAVVPSSGRAPSTVPRGLFQPSVKPPPLGCKVEVRSR